MIIQAFNNGFVISASVLVGRELGSGNISFSKRRAKITQTTSFLFSLIMSFIILFFGKNICTLYTSDESIKAICIAAFNKIMWIQLLMDSLQNT
jgi:Na+-driven multidrug efflux pump